VGSADVRDWQRLGHYGDHPHPQVADRETLSRMDKRYHRIKKVPQTNNA